MQLTQQYSVVSALMRDYTNYKEDDGGEGEHPYFSVGNGDYSEEHGHKLAYVMWAIIGGQLEVAQPIDPEEEGIFTSHNWMWGRAITDRDYKGRYEPQTGRLTIVKPEQSRYRDIPDIIMQKLESKFKNITEIRVF